MKLFAMKLININGPINAGKTTVSKRLVSHLPKSLFIEVDDLLSNAEQDAKGLDFHQGIECRLQRLNHQMRKEIKLRQYDWIVFAYPMSPDNFINWKLWEKPNVELIPITLAPEQSICQMNRGSRSLSEWEKQRISEMYLQKFNNPANTSLVIDNSNQSPQETTEVILRFLEMLPKAESSQGIR